MENINNTFIELLTNEPELIKEYFYIRKNQAFAIMWYNLVNNVNYQSIGENNILQILLTKNIINENLPNYNIKIHLPLKEEFLLKGSIKENIYEMNNDKNRDEIRNSNLDKIINFLDNKNVNFLDQDIKGNYIINNLITHILKLQNNKIRFFYDNSTLTKKINKFNYEQKLNLLSCIKDNWNLIWNNNNKIFFREHFIICGYKDEQNIFKVLNLLVNGLILKGIPKNYVDEKYNQIIKDVDDFKNHSEVAKNIVYKGAKLELINFLNNMPPKNNTNKIKIIKI